MPRLFKIFTITGILLVAYFVFQSNTTNAAVDCSVEMCHYEVVSEPSYPPSPDPDYPGYPSYLDYPNYPTYPTYPNYPGYPSYPSYGNDYPDYPNYPGYPSYPNYPSYPSYAIPTYPNYPTYPTYPTYPSYPTYPPGGAVITGVVETNCPTPQMRVNWNDVATELSYEIWRSTTAGDNSWVQVGGSLPANTVTYLDTTVAANTTYYYRVVAVNNTGASSSEAYNAGFMNPCLASLTVTKTISEVEGAPYNPETTIISEGDTITFRVVISNAGPSAATINFICDTPSSNFINFQGLSVAGGGLGNTITTPHASCNNNSRLNVSGNMPSGSGWTVTFNATFQSTGAGSLELCSNKAVVNYNDGEANGKTRTHTFGPRLCNDALINAPKFKEIAP